MRVIILTSLSKGIASRVLSELTKNKNIAIARVVLARGFSLNKKRELRRKLKKVLKIGLLGAINGVRLRAWYNDKDAEEIGRLCHRLGIEFTEVAHINSAATKEIFRLSKADIGLSLGNGYISKSIFSIPKYGMINLHTELLPDFQGAQSIIWPIFENRKETGFTIHQINSKIDAGRILFQDRYPIEFSPVLEETVRKNLKTARSKIPSAFLYVCENYEYLKDRAIEQSAGKSYTTPSIWQFFRMMKNNSALYKESLIKTSN